MSAFIPELEIHQVVDSRLGTLSQGYVQFSSNPYAKVTRGA